MSFAAGNGGTFLLLCLSLFAVPTGFAQSAAPTPMAPNGSSNSTVQGKVAPSDPQLGDDGARLMQLLASRPELITLLKSYFAQTLQMEAAEVGDKSITNQMLFSRIQTDPRFAKDASQWLVALAAETSQSLQAPLSVKGTNNQAAQASITAENRNPGVQSSSTSVSNDEPAAPIAAPVGGGTVSAPVPMPAINAETTNTSLRSLPKNLLEDQKAFWTLPFRQNVKDLAFIVPATFGSAILIGSDTSIESHLPNSPNTVKFAANASTAGMAALVGTGGGLFLLGQMTHDEHKREAGLLMGEAAIDAYVDSTSLQYITQRERPFTGNGRGQFFYGGNSFPSNTAAVSWAAATVLAHEYPGTLTKWLAYGVAAGVSAGRS